MEEKIRDVLVLSGLLDCVQIEVILSDIMRIIKECKCDYEEFLLINEIGNVVINKEKYPSNTKENAQQNWVYLSDVLEYWDKYGYNKKCNCGKSYDYKEIDSS